MESAVMGHTDSLLARPVSLLMVCHARRLEWVKSIDSTVSVHLALRLLSSLAKRSVAADTLPHLMLLVCVHTADLHTGRPSTGCGWLCNPSECAF